MKTREELDKRLREILMGNDIDISEGHIYFLPPPNVQLKFPALVYERSSRTVQRADNIAYIGYDEYDLTWISEDPDDRTADEICLGLDYCTISSIQSYDKMYHTRMRLYW